MSVGSKPGVAERLRIDVYLTPDELRAAMAEDVRRGLTAPRKFLPPKYFYDDDGSDLFERITEQPEYYPTRAERALLNAIAPALMAEVQPEEIVELGSGSSSKTRVCLDAAVSSGRLRRYVPVDVSEGMLRATARDLLAEYPSLTVHGVVADFERHLRLLPPPVGKRHVLFLGGTIGNLDPDDRAAFFRRVCGLLAPGDRFLMGMDMVKKASIIESAYNDAAGVTAAFNRNVLSAINGALGADFDPTAFRHHAFFDRSRSRIEMHLVSEREQVARIPTIGLAVRFREGEGIHTENSYKFTKKAMTAELRAAGLRVRRWYTNGDRRELFGMVLAGPA
ncbi:MAG: L-histidine N(alpha)-methyltransferase [SAR202 cluster bacterium]|nr:L-histidine N(alpha)-methyltransferase [SAR202 cluster bacterium]